MPTFGVKTNERPGTRAAGALRAHVRVQGARGARPHPRQGGAAGRRDPRSSVSATPPSSSASCLQSAMANAEHNDQIDPEELYVSACFADEGPTLKRWRPRARGRATRIRKRTCHITIIVSRLSRGAARAPPREREAQSTGRRRSWPAPLTGRRRRTPPARRQEPGARRGEAAEEADEHDHDHDDDDDEVVDGRRRSRPTTTRPETRRKSRPTRWPTRRRAVDDRSRADDGRRGHRRRRRSRPKKRTK